MSATEMTVLMVFGLPIIALCAMMAAAAMKMMQMEAAREKMRLAAYKARRYEAMRRRARGTPSKRPGGITVS